MEVSSRINSSSTSPSHGSSSSGNNNNNSNSTNDKQQQQSARSGTTMFGTIRNTVGVFFIIGMSFFSLLNNSKNVSISVLLDNNIKQSSSLFNTGIPGILSDTTTTTTKVRTGGSDTTTTVTRQGGEAETFAYNHEETTNSNSNPGVVPKDENKKREEVSDGSTAVINDTEQHPQNEQKVERMEKEALPVVPKKENKSEASTSGTTKDYTTKTSKDTTKDSTKDDDKEVTNGTRESNEKSETTKTTTTTDTKKTTTTGGGKYDPTKPINVVLFYADDWSFNMIGAVNDYLQTPMLDQLGNEGVLFTHNCVVASVCMQSRATLYTGQYSMRHQTYKSWADIAMYEPERWNQTLYPIMNRNEYYIGFFGKYHHLEDFPPGIPVFHKFRSSPLMHFYTRDGVEKHDTTWLEEDGMEFLDDRPRDKPFFLTLSFYATHAEDGTKAQYRPMNTSMHLYADKDVPYPKTYTEQHWKEMPFFFNDNNVGRARFRERYLTKEMYQHHMKNTCRMVTEVDTAIGRIIEKLKDQGVYDNTLIIFTTDNGNSHGQHGLAEKWYAYEESLRVPLIIKDPRMPESVVGTRNDEFTLNIDLAPTILAAAGIAVPDVMQGRDMAPLYLDNAKTAPKWRKEFLYEFHDGNADIPNSLALVTKEFKYIYWDSNNYTQFFKLGKDPFEEFDLYNTTEQKLLEEIWSRLLELNGTLLTDRTY